MGGGGGSFFGVIFVLHIDHYFTTYDVRKLGTLDFLSQRNFKKKLIQSGDLWGGWVEGRVVLLYDLISDTTNFLSCLYGYPVKWVLRQACVDGVSDFCVSTDACIISLMDDFCRIF